MRRLYVWRTIWSSGGVSYQRSCDVYRPTLLLSCWYQNKATFSPHESTRWYLHDTIGCIKFLNTYKNLTVYLHHIMTSEDTHCILVILLRINKPHNIYEKMNKFIHFCNKKWHVLRVSSCNLHVEWIGSVYLVYMCKEPKSHPSWFS